MKEKGALKSSALKSIYSFFKVMESLEKLAEGDDENMAVYAKNLLIECEKYPELRDGFDDVKLLEKHEVLITKLMRLIFPEALLTNEIKAVARPLDFSPFYLSTRFKNLLKSAGKDFSLESSVDDFMMYQFGCMGVLGFHFNLPVDLGTQFSFKIPNKKTGNARIYRIAYNADLMEFLPTENSLDITHDDYIELLDNFDDIELWKEKFPPNSWIMRGIGMFYLIDVTMEESLADITSNLLLKSNDSLDKIKSSIRNIVNRTNLEVGVINYENGVMVPQDENESMTSILIKEGTMDCRKWMSDHSYDQLITETKPLVISDVEKFDQQGQSPMCNALKKLKIESYIIAPLIHDGQLLAFLEISTQIKYELNSITLVKLKSILPILAMAISRFKMEDENLREAIIQKECTTIHPSVKWRFEEEANKYMAEQRISEDPIFQDIIFKNVYPLYGQMDIKSSSTIRNEGVQSDLIKQISGVKKVLTQAYLHTDMSIYEELNFRIDGFKIDIMDGLSAGSEHRTLQFIKKEIVPVFEQLKEVNSDLAQSVNDYEQLLHPKLKTVYEVRRRFDESVEQINSTLSAFLDNKQEEAQNVFPHYFEGYKTDGVEYNIYMGASISNVGNYNPIYLRNLRLWQLITMCEMEHKYHELQKNLSTPLEIASLILVYNSPMAIHFRMDEKRFSVEGAYNARYEVVKKRVDKAHIKGTTERITVPNKIAIVYSNKDDAHEYRMYIKYLEQKKYLKPNSLEELDLEDLQGVTGLKALRVEMEYSSSRKEILNIDEVIEEIESGLNSN